ncbi:metal-dependent hydrolase [Natronolimnohabitans sp. A-GB9]|uniref:metal-dependent hydrolase n=1 Tax=Natronolimnohabitans sp. A-GB9 TaxID=3069757 RepID=UPI0027B3446A|nr:metal-dependent hydrolase [Natronolimnohabitans sp. A-GB9]MDQ2050045.1 metal-dependent hydrolase [Natronolimnohabitans sp. A-GB9]
MMATTHVFAGLTLATAVVVTAPQFAGVVAVAAILGGCFPDLDLLAAHRKTLHFPVYYGVLAVPVTFAAVVVPTAATVGLAVFLLATTLHSVSDCFGGGLEPKPWRETSERAVYSHYHGRWLAPRRWIRYDGAPEDLALATVLAVPVLFVFDGVVQTIVLAMLALSLGYTLVRKPIARVGEWLVERTPDTVVSIVPADLLPVEDDRDRRKRNDNSND